MPEKMIDMPIRDANESHVAITLVLDVSVSMSGPSMDELNRGVNTMIDDFKKDSRLNKIVDLSIFTFGAKGRQNPYQSFRAIGDIEGAITLAATDGSTYIVAALEKAIDRTYARCKEYEENSACYTPWIIVITDGAFHDTDLITIGNTMIDLESRGKLHFFGLGVPGYDRSQLEKFANSPERVIDINAVDFVKFFSWIGNSIRTVTTKNPGEPTALSPWNVKA